jgi:antitoxin component of RelBE/YafQ-DinJ toxin-antitoxin module
MSSRISVRIDDAVRQTLEAEARSRNIPLSTLLNEIATEVARQIKRRRIREQSEAVARYVASSPEAAEFLEFWGTPRMEGLGRPPKLRSKPDD